MKKIRRILFVFIVFISIAILSGCGQTKEQLIQEMKEVYLEQNKERHPEATLEDITIEYYGKYGKGHIVTIEAKYLNIYYDCLREMRIDDLSFYYSRFYNVYYNKEFYSLETAYYEEEIVTLKDLEKFKINLQNKYYEEEYKLFQEMKEVFFEQHKEVFSQDAFSQGTLLEDLFIYLYYGKFGQAYIVSIYFPAIRPGWGPTIEVGGIYFGWGEVVGKVYYEGRFYGLAEAYDQGILTYQDLKDFKAVLNPDDV